MPLINYDVVGAVVVLGFAYAVWAWRDYGRRAEHRAYRQREAERDTAAVVRINEIIAEVRAEKLANFCRHAPESAVCDGRSSCDASCVGLVA